MFVRGFSQLVWIIELFWQNILPFFLQKGKYLAWLGESEPTDEDVFYVLSSRGCGLIIPICNTQEAS